MGITAVLWLGGVVLLVATPKVLGVNKCPKICECVDEFNVDCESVGLKNLPRDLSPSLTMFRAPFNNLTSLTKAAVKAMGTPRLVDLIIYNNSITTVESGALADLSELRWVDLSDNKIRALPPDALPPGLERLTMTGNPLGIPKDRALVPGASLQILDISYCNISGRLPRTLVAGNSNLTTLHVNDNRLTSFTADVIDKATMLDELNLSQNNLTALDKDILVNNPKITILDVSDNSIAIPEDGSFLKSSSLQELHLRNNGIKKLHRNTFAETPGLVVLDLYFNNITDIDMATFQGLANLTILNMGNNSLSSIHPDTFKSNAELTILNLEGNPLVLPKEGSRLTVPNLIDINLSSTGLTQLPPDSLQGMPLLEHVILANNAIEKLDMKALDGLTALKWVDLSGNPGVCGCRQPELVPWKDQRGIEVTALCEGPLGAQDVLAQGMCNATAEPLV